MHETESSTVTFEPPETEHRPAGSRLANFGNRIARGIERVRSEPPPIWEPEEDFQYPLPEQPEPAEEPRGRFPVVRHGYDPDLVEEYLVELERELLQTRAATAVSVDEEIARIGEQTSSILRVAHEKAQEMGRQANLEAEAERSQAAADAARIKRDAEQRLARLDADTDTIWRERERLLEDARSVATALFTLIDEAAERFPAEERTSDSEAGAAVERASGSPSPISAVPLVTQPLDGPAEPLGDADPGLPPEHGPGLGI